MTDIPNIPTIGALVITALTVITIFLVVIPFFILYFKKKKPATLTILVAFVCYFLAITSVFIGMLLQYLLKPEITELQISRYGFNIAYAFSALTNVFLVHLVSQIFAQHALFRRTKKAIPLINAVLNGVTIGLIIDTIMADYKNPAYPLAQTIYHLLLTFFAFTFLLAFSTQAYRKAQYSWEKAGFRFIMAGAIFGIMIYIMLVLDRIVSLYIPYFSSGYTIFSNLGWIFGIFMVSLCYLGFAMPKRLRDYFIDKEEKING